MCTVVLLYGLPHFWCVNVAVSAQVRLGELTNKCLDGGEQDLDYYVSEAAFILGLAGPGEVPDPKVRSALPSFGRHCSF